MKILALEFSSAKRSVAVWDTDGGASALRHGEVLELDSRSTRCFSLIEETLEAAALDRSAIDCLAVGLGPGSYTGIRAAIALAQGWELAASQNRMRLVGISSVECLAAQAHASGMRGRVLVLVDAQRNEFYLAQYAMDETSYREIERLRLASRAEVEERARAGEPIVGPEVTNCFSQARVLFPEASMLARLAAHQNAFVPGESLEPIYLRPTAFVKAPPPRQWNASGA
ncbi:MAG: tRNA (adenosine(37)-N6)-threonylcarbamoyltransferase complex dimerization subunit type 1 TsaB [Verrucomicrobiota bacterium]|jgi:tRNA threonylcarbamoyl adenosine modification protein YeaZ